MKTSSHAADGPHFGNDVQTAPATSLLGPLKWMLETVKANAVDRRMRHELAELDNAILKDIGIAEDEFYRIRARERFTPRAWRT